MNSKGLQVRRQTSQGQVSKKRFSLTAQGKMGYRLKTPYCDGATHMAASGLEPRINLNRYHGLFPHRVLIRVAED